LFWKPVKPFTLTAPCPETERERWKFQHELSLLSLVMPRFPNLKTSCSASAIFLKQRHFIHHTTLPDWDRFMHTLFPFAQDKMQAVLAK
jgi:hypothetical protein